MNVNNPETGMKAIALGTAGGPKWWGKETIDAGICTAIVVDGNVYLVDFGSGAGRQLHHAGYSFRDVAALFISHMHSDHIVDLSSLLLIGHHEVQNRKMTIMGPGPRGKLPPLTEHASSSPIPISPDDPVPGLKTTFKRIESAYSTDINDRMFDYGTVSPATKFNVQDILIPEGVAYDSNDCVAPKMDPFQIYEDENVLVQAILVDHHPTAPAYAFRFDSKYGSIVVSGDTGYCENVVTIAQGCDILFHEAIDLDMIKQTTMLSFPDVADYEPMMAHHRRSHTTALDAGRVASRADVQTLVLHHLVPANAPSGAWQAASETFNGTLIVAEDLQSIRVKAHELPQVDEAALEASQ